VIEGIKPYPEYKDSGQAWLASVPRHWAVLPNRAIFAEVKDRDHPDEQMLSVTITRGIVLQKELLADSTKKDSSRQDKTAYKLVEPHDVAYNKMRAWQGAIAASDFRGIISPAYIVMRLRGDQNARYFHHLYRTPHFAKEAERWSYGITSDMWSLRPEHFKMIYSAVPPRDEQTAIVRFLDHANGQIERAIRAKKNLIVLLNEQKQTIIHRAVTRGINLGVSVKPSGMAWIGDIPKHWRIVRNLALFSHRVEQGIPGLPVLQVSLRSGITVEPLNQFGRQKRLIAEHTKYKLVRKDDLAYNTMRMWQGAVGTSTTDGLVSPAYVVLKPRVDIFPRFYEFVFRTSEYKQQVNRFSTGIVSDRNRLYWESFKQMPNVSLPKDEQEAICRFIDNESTGLNKDIIRAERQVALLREYRTRLTADVVTGKLDVRDAARQLPELAEETETTLEIEDSTDAEIEDVEA